MPVGPLGFRRGGRRNPPRDLGPDLRRRWRRTTPYVALLIGQHAIRLHQGPGQPRRLERVARRAYAENNATSSLEASGLASRRSRKSDYAWLELADLCSLALCGGVSGDFEAGGFQGFPRHGLDGDDRPLRSQPCGSTPFPLAGTTTFRPPCRRIERRPYATDRELGRALAVARWSHRRVTAIAPG